MQENQTQAAPDKIERERKFPCHACGAELLFAPGQSTLKCPYCGHTEKIPETPEEIKEYSYNEYLAKARSEGYGKVPGERRNVRCDSCGAQTQFDASVRSSNCPFCGSPIVLDDEKDAGGDTDVVTPEAILPFKVTLAQAQEAFHKWIQSRWFAPNPLKRESHLKQIQGVYRPYWTYDSHTVSHWTGERGDAYYVTEHYTVTVNGKSERRTRQVRKVRWTYVSGVYREFFDDVLIFAGNTSDFPATYHLSDLRPYDPQYLSGFAAERYSLSCQDGWKNARDIIRDEIYSGVRGQIGGDEQRIHSVDTAYSGITYKHILLPLWISCYKYGNKSYCFQVNGQTGDVAGNRPYSFWKIFLLVLFIAAAIGIAVLIANKH